jgi:hypothetical protein
VVRWKCGGWWVVRKWGREERERREDTFLSVDMAEVTVWVYDVSYSALELFGFWV